MLDNMVAAEKPLNVLIVDDDEDVLEVVAALFERMGYDVKKASNGNNALGFILAERFDLLVTDYDMPEMNGYQLAKTTKKESPQTRVLIMTGLDRSKVAAELKTGLADGWLFKPFGLDSVLKFLGDNNQIKNNRVIRPLKN